MLSSSSYTSLALLRLCQSQRLHTLALQVQIGQVPHSHHSFQNLHSFHWSTVTHIGLLQPVWSNLHKHPCATHPDFLSHPSKLKIPINKTKIYCTKTLYHSLTEFSIRKINIQICQIYDKILGITQQTYKGVQNTSGTQASLPVGTELLPFTPETL